MEMEDAESGAEEASLPTAPNLRGAVPKNSEVEALHLRLAQLESLLQQQGQGPEVLHSVPAQPQRLLFNAAPTGDLTQAEWDTIKQKLGAAPKRLGKPERKTIPTQQAAEREMLIDEVEKEVLDPDALGTLAQLNLGGVTDPLQKLLILQVLQTSDMARTTLPLPPEAVQSTSKAMQLEKCTSRPWRTTRRSQRPFVAMLAKNLE